MQLTRGRHVVPLILLLQFYKYFISYLRALSNLVIDLPVILTMSCFVLWRSLEDK